MATCPLRGVETMEDRFASANSRGLFSIALIAISFLLVVLYLAGVYMVFSSGIALQTQEAREKKLTKEVKESELALQKELTSLAQNQVTILESMQRVSGIKYLSSPNFVSAEIIPHP